MIAKFKITDEDLIAQQRNALKHTKYFKRHRIAYLMVYVILFLFVLYVADLLEDIYIVISIFIILLPFVWIALGRAILRGTKRVLKQRMNKVGIFTLKLSDTGLTKESSYLTEKIHWDDIKMFQEDSERYFLYLTDLIAITIKKNPDNLNEKETLEYQAFIKRKANN